MVTGAEVMLYISAGANLNPLIIGLLAWNRDAQEYFRDGPRFDPGYRSSDLGRDRDDNRGAKMVGRTIDSRVVTDGLAGPG